MDNSKEGKASQEKSHIKITDRENKSEAGTSSKIVENVNNNNNSVGVSDSGNKTNTDDKRSKRETVDRQSSQLKNVEDCTPINNTKEESDGCVRKSNKSNQKIGTPKESFRKMQKDETTIDEDASASKKDCNGIKAATQDKLRIFEKREGTGGIGGQLYEIYLVLFILLYGLTNEKVTHFHLTSNLKEAGDFDDVVFSYTYKDLNGAEKIKVTFLQAKHKEKTKNITLEELLGKTGKGGFDLKKYFKSFRNIKKNFQRGQGSVDPIFGSDFEDCEFIIYTNALIKIGRTERDYIKELLAEEDWILNVNGERMKYYQLRFSENKNDRINTFLRSIGESEEQEFCEFLSKLKICTAQPNQNQLEEIIKKEIQIHYCVTRSDIETVFPVVKNKMEAWWKNSSEYLTEKATIIQNAARFSIRFEVQDPVPGFTGKEQSLRDLHKALQSTGHSVISQSASITGLGGIDKTELARKYVSQYSQYYDNNVIWINAETYSTTSESFRRLARDALGIGIKTIDGEDKDITCIKSEVYAFFAKRNKKSLFIFDNAEYLHESATAKVEENVTSFLPLGDNKVYVLITSRNQQWGGNQSVQLDVFTEEESAQFIKIMTLADEQARQDISNVKITGKSDDDNKKPCACGSVARSGLQCVICKSYIHLSCVKRVKSCCGSALSSNGNITPTTTSSEEIDFHKEAYLGMKERLVELKLVIQLLQDKVSYLESENKSLRSEVKNFPPNKITTILDLAEENTAPPPVAHAPPSQRTKVSSDSGSPPKPPSASARASTAGNAHR